MPRTGQPARLGQDALDQRRAVVRALGPEGLYRARRVNEENLAALDALDLDLAHPAGLQRDGREVLELVLLGHVGAESDASECTVSIHKTGMELWRRGGEKREEGTGLLSCQAPREEVHSPLGWSGTRALRGEGSSGRG